MYGWIYVLDTNLEGERPDTRIFKIGKTKNVTSRVKQLKTQFPYRLRIEYTFWTSHYDEIERQLHIIYDDYRMNGEWFSLGYDELSEIAEFCGHMGWYERDDGQMIGDPMYPLDAIVAEETLAAIEALEKNASLACAVKYRPLCTRASFEMEDLNDLSHIIVDWDDSERMQDESASLMEDEARAAREAMEEDDDEGRHDRETMKDEATFSPEEEAYDVEYAY